MRGAESWGMLCSEKELGLSEESAGIMVLPKESRIGVPLFEALGLKDTILEIGLTPNRADCLSIIGVAREIAAKLGVTVKHAGHVVEEKGADIAGLATVIRRGPGFLASALQQGLSQIREIRAFAPAGWG